MTECDVPKQLSAPQARKSRPAYELWEETAGAGKGIPAHVLQAARTKRERTQELTIDHSFNNPYLLFHKLDHNNILCLLPESFHTWVMPLIPTTKHKGDVDTVGLYMEAIMDQLVLRRTMETVSYTHLTLPTKRIV